MPYIIQQNLTRGKKANRLGLGLLLLMAACLLLSVALGVFALGA